MSISPRGGLVALLIPAVIVSGLTGAVVANAESVSQVRAAQADYADAWDSAVAVHERAEAALRDAAALALRADQLLYTAHTFQGLAHLEGDSVAALGKLVESLDLALAVPLPAEVALPAKLRSESPAELAAGSDVLRQWADALASAWAEVPPSGVPGTLQALESGLDDVAQGIATAGGALLASKTGASAQTRAALTASMEEVSRAIADGRSTFAAVTAYVTAAQAVVDSQAAADAAAASAAAQASASSESDDGPSTFDGLAWCEQTMRELNEELGLPPWQGTCVPG